MRAQQAWGPREKNEWGLQHCLQGAIYTDNAFEKFKQHLGRNSVRLAASQSERCFVPLLLWRYVVIFRRIVLALYISLTKVIQLLVNLLRFWLISFVYYLCSFVCSSKLSLHKGKFNCQFATIFSALLFKTFIYDRIINFYLNTDNTSDHLLLKLIINASPFFLPQKCYVVMLPFNRIVNRKEQTVRCSDSHIHEAV